MGVWVYVLFIERSELLVVFWFFLGVRSGIELITLPWKGFLWIFLRKKGVFFVWKRLDFGDESGFLYMEIRDLGGFHEGGE